MCRGWCGLVKKDGGQWVFIFPPCIYRMAAPFLTLLSGALAAQIVGSENWGDNKLYRVGPSASDVRRALNHRSVIRG